MNNINMNGTDQLRAMNQKLNYDSNEKERVWMTIRLILPLTLKTTYGFEYKLN